MIKIAKDILAETPTLVAADSEIKNGDGSISFKLGNKYISQEPNLYGNFNFVDSIGPYEKFRPINDMVMTSWTRPQDEMFIYTRIEFSVYGY